MKKWKHFVGSLALDQRTEFDKGDIGLPGGAVFSFLSRWTEDRHVYASPIGVWEKAIPFLIFQTQHNQ